VGRSRVVNLANFQTFQAINVLSDPGHIGGAIVIPNCVRVILRWSLTNGKTAHNVIAGQVGASFTPTAAIAEAIRAGLVAGSNWTSYAGFLASTTALAGVDIQDLRSTTATIVSSTGASTPGTSVSAAVPGEVSAVVTVKTNMRGPAGRGRIYLTGFATNGLGAGDLISGGLQGAISVFINNLSTAFTGQGITPGLAQPARNAYTGSTGTSHPARVASVVTPVTFAQRDQHWDTQRRRGLK
jgi:hypothetical protein